MVFMWTNFVGKIYREIVLHGATNDQVIPWGRGFRNKFSSNVNTKSEKFSQPWRNIHLKIKPWPFYRIMEGFILKVDSLEVKRFQRLCHVIWGIDIFEKLTPEIGS